MLSVHFLVLIAAAMAAACTVSAITIGFVSEPDEYYEELASGNN